MRILGSDSFNESDSSINKIPVTYLKDGDMCMVQDTDIIYFYEYNASIFQAESVPDVITPIDNIEGDDGGRWVLCSHSTPVLRANELLPVQINSDGEGQNIYVDGSNFVIYPRGSWSRTAITINTVTTNPPLIVNSPLKVDNFNADLLNGLTSNRFILNESYTSFIIDGVSEQTFRLPQNVLYTTYSVYIDIKNVIDESPSIYDCIVIDKQLDEFTVSFSSTIDSPNYELNYLVVGKFDEYNKESPTIESYPFSTTWRTTADQESITLPLVSGFAYDFEVSWGDGNVNRITSYNQAEITHTYLYSGDHTVMITGVCETWRFGGAGDKNKLMFINNWGDIGLTSTESMFSGCVNMECTATDVPNLELVLNASSMFMNCVNFNGAIGNWITSSFINVASMLQGCVLFNQPINEWGMASVTNTTYMLQGCAVFNQPIGEWNTGNINDMRNMLQGCYIFQQNLGTWNISSVLNMDFFLDGVGLLRSNYDALLIGWEAQTVQSNVSFNAGSSLYTCGSAAETARTNLITISNWNITDAGC